MGHVDGEPPQPFEMEPWQEKVLLRQPDGSFVVKRFVFEMPRRLSSAERLRLEAAWREAVANPGPLEVLSEPEVLPIARCASCVHWRTQMGSMSGRCQMLGTRDAPLRALGEPEDIETDATFGCTEWEAKPDA